MRPSTNDISHPHGNAAAERFFLTLKNDLVHHSDFQSGAEGALGDLHPRSGILQPATPTPECRISHFASRRRGSQCTLDAELVGAIERAHPLIAAVASHDAPETRPRHEIHDLHKQRLADVHNGPRVGNTRDHRRNRPLRSSRHQVISTLTPRQIRTFRQSRLRWPDSSGAAVCSKPAVWKCRFPRWAMKYRMLLFSRWTWKSRDEDSAGRAPTHWSEQAAHGHYWLSLCR